MVTIERVSWMVIGAGEGTEEGTEAVVEMMTGIEIEIEIAILRKGTTMTMQSNRTKTMTMTETWRKKIIDPSSLEICWMLLK